MATHQHLKVNPSMAPYLKTARPHFLKTLAMLAIASACTLGLMSPSFAESESRGNRDASGVKDALSEQAAQTAGEPVPTWSDVEKSYDAASAAWLQIYGEQPFIQAKPWIESAAKAIRNMGWINADINLVIAMLDGRGDMAEYDDAKKSCRVQVNIDEQASSPVIRALGGFGSSIAFIAAHELAHCTFDGLGPNERLPTRAMLVKAGASEKLALHLMGLFNRPTEDNGGHNLVNAYDEALADAAASIALRADEERVGSTARYGSALENAESVRFGGLAQSMRRKVTAEVHQGAFVFSAVNALPLKELVWDQARYIALKSVLSSTLMMTERPRWFKQLPRAVASDSARLAKAWKRKALHIARSRDLEADETRYLSAASPALFAFNPVDGKGAYQDEPEAAMQRWKNAAWVTLKSSTTSLDSTAYSNK